MKRKLVMAYDPLFPAGKWKKEKKVLTAQLTDNVLILDYFERKDKQEWKARHCLNVKTNEFETYFPERESWTRTNLVGIYDENHYHSAYYMEKDVKLSPDHVKLIQSSLDTSQKNVLEVIETREVQRGADQRERKQNRKEERVQALMDTVPPLPEDIKSWIRTITGNQNYAFYNKITGTWKKTCCTASGEPYRPEGGKIRHNDTVICPACNAQMIAKKRTDRIEHKIRIMLLQKIDEQTSVSRHFRVSMVYEGSKSKVLLTEDVRIFLGAKVKIYYAIDRVIYSAGIPRLVNWWDSNPDNRQTGICYLHPQGIEEALKNTNYKEWTRLFEQMATQGVETDYNKLMTVGSDMFPIVEYLFKGRFWRLLRETVQRTTMYGGYYGVLNIRGTNEREVMMLQDRQSILRIRQLNGGEQHIKWLRYAEEEGIKINQETLEWLISSKIPPSELRLISAWMTPQQVMNYIIKQKKTQYQKLSASAIMTQWNDYLSMCRVAKKDLNDEMIHRPKELKRRHDEMLIYAQRAQIIQDMERNPEANKKYADEMAAKFPGAEENLKAAKAKYEYQNEEYIITVPDRLVDIVKEGNALHHCAGSSERYFERLMSRETCICFLRRATEPDIPFYTIEVEPNGTIRQHRSYLDEEPGIEEIRGFLREWQQVVKKRIKKEDHELQKISAEKRERNIQDLIAKNNTRVLQGLMEDFMEAM